MKHRITSLTTLLVIGLFSSASALAAPPDHGNRDHRPAQHSAPPPKHQPAPPPRFQPAPPPSQVHHAPHPSAHVTRHHEHHGRSWERGRALPRTVVYHNVPSYKRYKLSPPPRGHRYVRVDNDILLIAIGTGMIVNAIYDIAR